jgi:hypothetical protein
MLFRERQLLFGRRFSVPERIRDFIVPAATAEKHQGHEPASDDKRKESAKAERDPAMDVHVDIGIRIPDRNHPHGGKHEKDNQHCQKSDSTHTKTLHCHTSVLPVPELIAPLSSREVLLFHSRLALCGEERLVGDEEHHMEMLADSFDILCVARGSYQPPDIDQGFALVHRKPLQLPGQEAVRIFTDL